MPIIPQWANDHISTGWEWDGGQLALVGLFYWPDTSSAGPAKVLIFYWNLKISSLSIWTKDIFPYRQLLIDLFHNDFSPSGKQPEHCKLAHTKCGGITTNLTLRNHWGYVNQSINQSNPDSLKERVRIPRTCRDGGEAMLWSAPVRRGRLLSTVLHRWSPRHSILSAGLR